MLSMDDVSYRYNKKSKWILTNLTKSFSEGKFYMISGPSGSGKTTCLYLLGGLDGPERGTVDYNGKNICELGYDRFRRDNVGFIFQDYHLFRYMSAMENVITALYIRNPGITYAAARSKAEEALEAVGLNKDDLNRKVTMLSGGQQQRIAIARTIATEAKYILADEPTGNLDNDNAEIIMNIFRRLVTNNGRCVIMATHARELHVYADEILTLNSGNLIKETENV